MSRGTQQPRCIVCGVAITAVAFPEGDISFMHAISPIGAKFHAASAYGPESQLNLVNGRTGTCTGTLHFAFGPADRK